MSQATYASVILLASYKSMCKGIAYSINKVCKECCLLALASLWTRYLLLQKRLLNTTVQWRLLLQLMALILGFGLGQCGILYSNLICINLSHSSPSARPLAPPVGFSSIALAVCEVWLRKFVILGRSAKMCSPKNFFTKGRTKFFWH